MEKLKKIMELMETVSDVRRGARYHFLRLMKGKDINLTLEMMEILRLLWNKNQMNQQEIVNKTQRNKASITSLLDNMSRRGLIIRTPDASDKRNNLVSLTEEGRNYRIVLIPILEEMYRNVYEELSEEEIDNAISLLKEIEKKL